MAHSKYSTNHTAYDTPRMPFGKHAGARIDSDTIPTHYLVWFLENTNPDYELRRAIERELDARNGDCKSEQKQAPPSVKAVRVPAEVTLETALELVSTGQRGLAKKVHPDRGGSNEAMSSVNAVADWLREHLASVLL